MERHARIVKSYKAGKITELWQQLGVSAPKAKGLAKSARKSSKQRANETV